jgi:putative endonuclease
MYFTYIQQSEQTGRYYIGSTQDISARLKEHNTGKSPYTSYQRPWKLIYHESYSTLVEARRRERQIKSWKNPNYMIKTLDLQS